MAAKAPISAAECFMPAFKAANAEAVAACYAEDAIIWFPGGPMAKGRAAIRDGFAGYFEHMTVKQASLTPMGEEKIGNTRVAWGRYAFVLVNKDTQAESVENGRYTDVQKLIDGKWLYIVDHPSDDPTPTAE
ncbi:MAG: YybH family protein [Thermomonas sp.]